LGNDQSIYFWKDVWLEDQRLDVKFPRLFGISSFFGVAFQTRVGCVG
jgi:hypothetical protein